jgi:hypothetical protein
VVEPGRTKSRLVPRDWRLEVMVCCTPLPIAIKEITAATPMTIPNKVSPARSLLDPREESATRKVANGVICLPSLRQ